ncbi:MAG TPA: MFS transporter, partial [Streptomyces sp.]
MTTSDLEKSPDSRRKEIRRVVASSYLGNLIEIYDFVLYGSAAALVLGPLFFGNLSPAMATVASFGTLATGFIARPVGGILFGYLGDRVGRKPVLIATLTLMGLASGCIGLLPTQAQIGVAAPIVLVVLRLLQGIAAGGEWGGSVLMIAEHSDRRRRGLLS